MSPLYNTLLGIARQAKVWLTPAHQSYAQIPTGSVPLWSEEFRDWILQKLNFQTGFTSIIYNRVLRQLDQEAKSAPARLSGKSTSESPPSKAATKSTSVAQPSS